MASVRQRPIAFVCSALLCWPSIVTAATAAVTYNMFLRGKRVRVAQQPHPVCARNEPSLRDVRWHVGIGLAAALVLTLAIPADAGSGSASGSLIVIATGGTSEYGFTSKAAGVMFDIDGDGVKEQIAWTEPGSDVAFLAWDRNNNGRIDNGTELFGDYTFPGVRAFAALLKMQTNQDGSLDRNDAVFPQLLLWRDKNHNGLSEPNELSLVYETLEAVGLGWDGSGGFVDENSNRFGLRGWARKTVPGKNGLQEITRDEHYHAPEREFSIYHVAPVR